MIETIEFVSFLVTFAIAIGGGFGGIFTFLAKILKYVKQNADAIQKNHDDLVQLKADIEIEFAKCHLHHCEGNLTK